MTDDEPLLSVDNLKTHLRTDDGIVHAVDGVSFDVHEGETVCLVGESGSGKTLTCDSITGLVGPDADITGAVRFSGVDLLRMEESDLRSIRGNRIAYVFQNSRAALDPVYTIGEQIIEAIQFHEDVSDDEARERAVELIRQVGLSRAEHRLSEYPHEFSDGMCQRAAIAIALAAEPDLLIADEPTSALDVTIQARIIDLLSDLREEHDLSMLLVTHDLRVVAELADRVVVMFGGTVVEQGSVHDVYEQPAHPYTQALFDSFSGTEVSQEREEIPTSGCRFHRECPHAIDACRGEEPPMYPVREGSDHRVGCVFYGPDRDPGEILAAGVEMAPAGATDGRRLTETDAAEPDANTRTEGGDSDR